jgi:hypothetical protein
MTVTAFPKDSAGAALATAVTARTTAAAALANGPAKVAANVQLDADQQALVIHYMEHGRLTAANILATMT